MAPVTEKRYDIRHRTGPGARHSQAPDSKDPMITLTEPQPNVRQWLEGNAQHLDIREFLRNGGRPYSMLMDTARQVAQGDVLVVHVLFDPQPLRKQLRRLGLSEECQQVEDEHWLLTIRRPEGTTS